MKTHTSAHIQQPTQDLKTYYLVTSNGQTAYAGTNGIEALRCLIEKQKDPNTINIDYRIRKNMPVPHEISRQDTEKLPHL